MPHITFDIMFYLGEQHHILWVQDFLQHRLPFSTTVEHTLHIVAWHLSERHYHLTETFILFCQSYLFVINCTQVKY